MRNFYFILSFVSAAMLFGCKKSDSGGGTAGGNSSVSYKVNGNSVNVQGDYDTQANAEGASFILIPAMGQVVPHYYFTARKSDGTLVGISVLTNSSSFSTGTFKTPVDPIGQAYGASLSMGGKDYATTATSDSTLVVDVKVSKYSGNRADGTFSGKMGRVINIDGQGNATYEFVTITEGTFRNVLVKQQ